MSTEWKPGDVAMADGCLMMRTQNGWLYASRGPEVNYTHAEGSSADRVTSLARPLVTINPEDREAVERLWTVLRDGLALRSRDNLVAALREFANPTPPIEEPTAPYAVVRDKTDHEWCHIGGQVWRSLTSTGQFMVEKHWHDNDSPLAGNVVAILSPGYTEDGA